MDTRNFATIWEGLADALGGEVCVVQGERRMTWAEWDAEAARVAGWLEARGVGVDDRVAIVAYNCPELFVLIHAAFKLRAVPVALNYRYRVVELAEVLEDCAAPVVCFHGSLAGEMAGARGRATQVRHWVCMDDGAPDVPWATRYEQVRASEPATRRERSTDDTLMQYTGGTTGKPKGVLWTHRGILDLTAITSYMPLGHGIPDTVEQMVEIAAEQVRGGTAPVYLVSVPLMHGTGFWGACSQLQIGGRLVMLESRSFDAAEMLTLISEYHIKSVVIVGDAFAQPLVEELERAAAAGTPYGLSSLEGVTSSGVTFSAPYKRRLMVHARNALVFEAIGGSEGGPLATSMTMPGTAPPDTAVFTAGPNTVLIDENRIVPWGTSGTYLLGFRGGLPLGYFGDPEKTAATFREIDGDRYLVSGDMGSIDDAGTLHFTGRGNTVINSGGEKVFPGEVEEVIKLHPAIKDCLVVAVPDERFGSAVAVVVARREGTDVDVEAVRTHTGERLAGYKVPRHVIVVDEVRRSAAGKSDYRWASEVAAAAVTDRDGG